MPPSNDEKKDDAAQNLTNCLFSQYRFFVAGIGLGTAYHLHSKAGPAPMIVAGLGGSLADLIYGYTVECQKEVEAYNNQPKEN